MWGNWIDTPRSQGDLAEVAGSVPMWMNIEPRLKWPRFFIWLAGGDSNHRPPGYQLGGLRFEKEVADPLDLRL